MSIEEITLRDYNKFINSKDKVNINGSVYIYVGQGGQGVIFKNETTGKIIKLFKKKLNKSIINELVFMKMCKYALDKNYTPGLIEYYEDKYLDMNVIVSMEQLDNTLEEWSSFHKSKEDWTSMLFQLIQITLTMNNILFIKHNDMKPKNIMYKKLNRKIIHKYNINDKSYYVPITYLFKVIDFGHSEYDSKKNTTHNPKDLEQIFILYKRELVNKIIDNTSTEELKQLAIKSNKFESYYKKEYDYILNTFNKYPDSIKNKMCKKAIAYFVVENELINIDKYENILPDKSIIDAMKRFESMNFNDLLRDDLFNGYKDKINYDKEFTINAKI